MGVDAAPVGMTRRRHVAVAPQPDLAVCVEAQVVESRAVSAKPHSLRLAPGRMLRQIHPLTQIPETVHAKTARRPQVPPVPVSGVFRDQAGVTGVGVQLRPDGALDNRQIPHRLLPIMLAEQHRSLDGPAKMSVTVSRIHARPHRHGQMRIFPRQRRTIPVHVHHNERTQPGRVDLDVTPPAGARFVADHQSVAEIVRTVWAARKAALEQLELGLVLIVTRGLLYHFLALNVK